VIKNELRASISGEIANFSNTNDPISTGVKKRSSTGLEQFGFEGK